MSKKDFVIKTERIILRPLELNDLESTHKYSSDLENTKYMLFLPNNTLEETEQFLQKATDEWKKDKPAFYEYAIILGEKHIGGISIYMEENSPYAELGWILHKNYQGNGYATEAAKAILDFAINELKIKKIIAHCDYRNKASASVMLKIGLSLESNDGTRRYKDSDCDIPEYAYSLKLVV